MPWEGEVGGSLTEGYFMVQPLSLTSAGLLTRQQTLQHGFGGQQ
jgi:hypothetical protein